MKKLIYSLIKESINILIDNGELSKDCANIDFDVYIKDGMYCTNAAFKLYEILKKENNYERNV